MFLLLSLLPIVALCLGSEQLNVTQVTTDPLSEVTEAASGEEARWGGSTESAAVAAATQATAPGVPKLTVATAPALPQLTPATRGPRLARRKPRRSRRFRPGGPRYREQPYNVYNPYYRQPQTYYDMYYNPYQGYYPEYAQPGYYPQYPYQPQQPYPQPYPYPPPPPVIPTPPPTLAPIPDLYYVQNTDGHYQYRRVSVTRRSPDSQWGQYPDRRSSPDYRYPRRPGRPAEFRPPLKLTSAPHQAQVFGVTSPPPTQAPETGGG